MKKTKLAKYAPVTLTAVGVLLGRGAQADTVLNFNALPPGQSHNSAILQTFGDNALVSSPGVSVTGIGTPDVGLSYRAFSATSDPLTRWDYYLSGPWSAGQLNESRVGDYHELVFTPIAAAGVSINSFNFHGYYNSAERFSYDWNVLDGQTTSSLANGSISFVSDGTKNHPVAINYTGAIGEELVLRLTRVSSTPFLTGGQFEGDKGDIAIDDVSFSQVPEPGTLTLLSGSLAGLALMLRRKKHRK